MTIPVASSEVQAELAALASRDLGVEPFRAATLPLWAGLRGTGSQLWLDTGDLDEAAQHWTAEFSALTTNNTLLNKEIQKGIYDQLIAATAPLLRALPPARQVLEVGFLLNARHGQRLAKRYGGLVSVELSTELAHDVAGSLHYGRRYAAISKDFVVKIPLSPAGMLAARTLAAEGIRINFTLGFAARQNHVIARFVRPAWVNVFLGRDNAYVIDNQLGDGANIGEKALLASQRTLRDVKTGTKQIAASLRSAEQVAAIAGVDVYTMPTAVAGKVRAGAAPAWRDRTGEDPAVNIPAAAKPARLNTLWDIDESAELFAASLVELPPATPDELIDRAEACGAGEMFPRLTAADQQRIAADGKIPKHAAWADRIARGELAVDTLLTMAGLASFTADQAALDQRIRKCLGLG